MEEKVRDAAASAAEVQDSELPLTFGHVQPASQMLGGNSGLASAGMISECAIHVAESKRTAGLGPQA